MVSLRSLKRLQLYRNISLVTKTKQVFSPLFDLTMEDSSNPGASQAHNGLYKSGILLPFFKTFPPPRICPGVQTSFQSHKIQYELNIWLIKVLLKAKQRVSLVKGRCRRKYSRRYLPDTAWRLGLLTENQKVVVLPGSSAAWDCNQDVFMSEAFLPARDGAPILMP